MFVRNRPPIPVTGGLSDTILKDSTNTQFIARDDSGVFTYVTLDGAPYVPVPPITALFVAGVSTAAKQDDQSLILDEIRSGLIPLATAGKQDSLQTLMTSMAAAVATATKQDNQMTLMSALNGMVATGTKQDVGNTILANIFSDMATDAGLDAVLAELVSIFGAMATASGQALLQTAVAKEAKQDSQITLATSLNGLVATSANQVTANGYLNTLATRVYDIVMDYRQAAALNLIPGARTLILAGNAVNIQTSHPPMLLWDAKITFPWQTAAVAMEVVSDNPNDTAGGTGARTFMVTMVDLNWNEQTYVLPMNGTTGVPLPTSHFGCNRFDVVQSGSNHGNIGTLRIRPVATPAQTIGYIAPNQSSMKASILTVPAGKKLQVDNFYIDTLSGNHSVDIDIQLNVRLIDGTIQVRQENFAFSGNNPNNAAFSTPFTLPEKTTLFIQIVSVSANGANISISSGAVISNA